MKTIPSKDVREVQCLAQFKAAWLALGYPTLLSIDSFKMPRDRYAYCIADTVSWFQKEYEADSQEAIINVLQTSLGNASQLGAKLIKEKWLTEASPVEAADSFLETLRKRALERAQPKAV